MMQDQINKTHRSGKLLKQFAGGSDEMHFFVVSKNEAADNATRCNRQTRNTICHTSVAAEVLSKVAGWRVDAEGEEHRHS